MRPDLSQRLRGLREGTPPPYDYAEFSHRYSRRRARHSQRPLRLLGAALAVMVAGWALKHAMVPLITEGPPVAQAPVRSYAPLALETAAQRPVLLPTENAESWLNAHPRRALIQVPTQMAVTELEDQIATMDDRLNTVRLSHPQVQQLAAMQRDRAQMIESLAQVRYAQNLVAGLP